MTAVPANGTSIDELLRTADLLLAGAVSALGADGSVGTAAAARNRGAALALRTVLEIAINQALEAAVPGLSSTNMRAKLLCLRGYAGRETARQAAAVWSHVCLGCHYHQYEIGPADAQVRAWRNETAALVSRLAR
jgi:hypothetical protein